MRTFRTVVFVLLLGLFGAACGARLNAAERQQAANAALNGGNGGLGQNGSGLGPDAGTGTLPPGASASTGPLGSGAGPNGGGTKGGTKPGSTTSNGNGCPSGGTDTGLTANSVSLGTIASTTGPVSGLFEGAIEGAQAFRAFLNYQGGLCGHTVSVVAADDGTNCAENQNATQDLAGRVFAFVGSFSLYDGCGASFLKAHPDIPDLHVQLSPAAGAIPNNFDIEPGPLGYATGPFAYYAKKYGDKVKHVGTLYPNIPSAVQKQHAFEHAAESVGWQFVYERAADATESDWTGDFVNMCQRQHIQIFFTDAENAQNAAKMVNDESAAGCPKSLINIIPIAYDQAFVPDVGNTSAVEGMVGWNEYSLFFNRDEAQHIPELAQLQTWFGRTYPGKPLNLYALFAWAEGRLFQQAFEHAGPTINRSTLMAALRKITNFSADGIVAPVNPNSHTQGPYCYILWQFHNGQFQRVDDPATGYRCDGRFLPLSSG